MSSSEALHQPDDGEQQTQEEDLGRKARQRLYEYYRNLAETGQLSHPNDQERWEILKKEKEQGLI